MMNGAELSEIIINLKELSANKEMDTDTKILLYNLGSDHKITRYVDCEHFYVVEYCYCNYIILTEELEPLLISSGISSTSFGQLYTGRVTLDEDMSELLEVYPGQSRGLTDEAKKALKYNCLITDENGIALLDSETLTFVNCINDELAYTLEKMTDNGDFFINIQSFYEEEYDEEYDETSGYTFGVAELCTTNISDELGIPCITWYNFDQHKILGQYSECFDYGYYKWCKVTKSATKWQRFRETETGFEPCEIRNLPKELNSKNLEQFKEYLR